MMHDVTWFIGTHLLCSRTWGQRNLYLQHLLPYIKHSTANFSWSCQ